MAGLPHKLERSKIRKRQNRSDHKITSTQKRERIGIFSRINTTSIQIHKQPFQKDRQNEKTIKERCKLGVDAGDFEKLKEEIMEAPCLAHCDPKKDNFINTDACNTSFGATRWQKEGKVSRPTASFVKEKTPLMN